MMSEKKQTDSTTDNTRESLSRHLLWGSILVSLVIFAWCAQSSFRRVINQSSRTQSVDDNGSIVINTLGAVSAENVRIREAALSNDRALVQRVRKQRKVVATPSTLTDRHDVARRYQDRRQRIEDHLRQTVQDDPEAKIPKDYLKSLDEQFADGPQ